MYAPYAGICRAGNVRAITTSPYFTHGVIQWYPTQGARYFAATASGNTPRPTTYPTVPACVHAPTANAPASTQTHAVREARGSTTSTAAATCAGINAAGSTRPHE
ncbi:hypothetical protein SNL152K_6195 [Streptomyces sp. NL15-2K]|nr:hypothetical protein SNL152K_6195 [Streptomyces sp. NL15-2K]